MILKGGKRIDGCSDTLPIGTIQPYVGEVAPTGYLICEGQKVSKTTYNELYTLCGDKFGASTATEFYLPDLRGRTIAGYKEGDSIFGLLGNNIGEATHTLKLNELPEHKHGLGSEGAIAYGGYRGYFSTSGNIQTWAQNDRNVTVDYAGGNAPHNNVQPTAVLNWIVKAYMVLPLSATVDNTLGSESTINALSAAQGKILNETKQNVLTEGENISIIDDEISAIVPVKSVNGKTGAVTLNAADVGALSSSFRETDPTVPSHVKSITQTNINNWNNKAEISDIPDVTSFINKDVNNLTYYELKSKTGTALTLSIDSKTYVLTASLKNSAGTVLSTQKVDLPLESLVTNATYDKTNKKIILTLQSGATVDVSVADLIDGLIDTTTFNTELNKKVDKIKGKGLSTNDYTTAEKNKLSGIANGAEVNVQSDWKVTDTSADAYIKNKPTKLSDFTNDAGYITSSGGITGNAASATKLETSRTIGIGSGATGTATNFNGTSNITIPVTDIKESYVSWGGKSLNQPSPIDMGCIDEFGHNKLSYLPAGCIKIEYTTDGGTTWLDYGATDAQKVKMVTTSGDAFMIGKGTVSATDGTLTNANCGNYKVRTTISTRDRSRATRLYTSLAKILINFTTNGAKNCKCLVQTRSIANYNNNADVWDNKGTYAVSGWSGWNSIPLSGSFGGGSSQTSQWADIRLTFSISGVDTNFNCRAAFMDIRMIGKTNWQTPSELARSGRLYTIDENQNATFPGNITSIGGTINGVSTGSKYLINTDTRTTNAAPSSYMVGDKGPGHAVSYEFKNSSAIDTPVQGTYCSLFTITPWNDSSGGLPVQIVTNNTSKKILYRAATSNAEWGNWITLATTENIPTKVSQLTNDSGYLTSYTETDPTVPAHVKSITQANINTWNGKQNALVFNSTYNASTNKVATMLDVPTNNNQLANGAGYQTATQVSAAITTALQNFQTINYEIVTTLPTTGKIGTIYLIAKTGKGKDVYDEYIYINNKFELIGTTAADLSNYWTKTDIVALTNKEIDAAIALA